MGKVSFRTVEAPEGQWVTQVAEVEPADRIFTKIVYLGKADSPDNWKLVSDEYRDSVLAEN